MGSLVRRSFPVILGMAAHHVRGAKVIGMQCMKRLIDLASPSELTKYGYHEALFESLKALFVFPEHTEDAFEIILHLVSKCETPLSAPYVAKCDYLLHFVMREIVSERSILVHPIYTRIGSIAAIGSHHRCPKCLLHSVLEKHRPTFARSCRDRSGRH